jgi:hypothetical protein
MAREDRAFAGTLARAMGRALLDDPTACGDELLMGAVRRAELELEAKGTDLDTRAKERAEEHHAALQAILDGMPAPPELPPFPVPEPPPPPSTVTTVDQPALPLAWGERGTGA